MNDLVMRLRGWLWWILPLALFVVLLGIETDLGRAVFVHPAPENPLAPKPVVVSLLPEYAIDGGTTSRGETTARTLFNPTRRPAPVPAPEVVQRRMQRGQFALTGTTVAGERSLAFLKEVAGGKPRTVKLGDTVNGMLVAEVKPDRVKLTQAGESEELVLRVAGNTKPTPQPAAGAAQPNLQQQILLPGQQAPPPVATSEPEVPQTLAERRRSARAIEAAARAQAAEASQQSAVPPPATSGPMAQPAAAAGAAGAATGQTDTGWAAVFQRYQQRRQQ